MNDTRCDLSMNMNMDMDMGGGGRMMKMFFHFDACQRLIFHSWTITNAGELVGAIVVSFLLAIFYEGLKTLREWLLYFDLKHSKKRDKVSENDLSSHSSDKIHLVNSTLKQPSKVKSISISFGMHVLQSFLHVIQVGYGYILMFIAMTFNGWLFLSVCFGAGVGYFIFAKTRHILGVNNRDNNEHCH